jgi:catechol 2,3-dioxygenase-like lactoylglutathione lyase family enzyme
VSEPVLSGFDHVTVAVRELERAIADYTRLLGAEPVWQGEHPELGTRAALFGLDNALVELVAAHKDAAAAEGLRARLATQGEGLPAIAFATADAEACSAALRARGLRVTAPEAGEARGRDGSVRTYRAVELSRRVTRGLAVYSVERSDDAALRAPAPAKEAAHALDHVVIRTSAPDAAVALYGEGLGIRLALDRELGGRRMLFFRVGGVTVEIVADAKLGDEDAFYGLAYRVRDLDAAHARLREAGFSLSEPRTGNKPGTRVFTVRDQTCGVPTLIIHDPARG